MREDRCALRIDARSEVVGEELAHRALDIPRDVTIRNHLVISDEDPGLYPLLLKANPVLERAEIVADMQSTRGAISGEHAKDRRVLRELFLNLSVALERRLVGLGGRVGGVHAF